MNAGLDFALAQVRDRDLVIKSLREQLEIFREDAEEAQKVRGALQLAAPAGYAVAHIKQMEADLEAAEAKLAEDAHRNDQLKRERDKYRAKLAEVEEERDKPEEYAKEGWDWLSEALDALGAKTVFDIKARAAAMDRARELAERQVPIARKEAEWTREATWSDAAIAFDQIARLLGGDDEPK